MLEIEHLSAGYGMVPVLHEVTLRVKPGEFAAIVGPNGAGKTTLFKTVSGIVRPTAGSIRFEGRDLLAVAPAARAHLGIAHIPEGRQVFPSLTVLENLQMGAYTKAGRRAWKENLEKIHTWFPVLAERAKALAGALSGGQQQMLAIARGLAASPKLLMLDEPSMGLAPAMGFWLEIVTLLIPGFNDGRDEIARLTSFVAGVSPDIPWHVTAFHSDYKMTDTQDTTAEMLLVAADIGRANGLRHVYAGNLPGRVGDLENTRCAACGEVVVSRYGYAIREYRLTAEGRCPSCAAAVPGRWSERFDGQVASRPFVPGSRRLTILNP